MSPILCNPKYTKIMQTWLLFVFILVIIVYLVYWSTLRRRKALLANLPGYPQVPILGNVLKIVGDGKVWFRRFTEITDMSEKAQKPFVLWMGPVPVLITGDPDDVREITNTFIEKPYYYNFARAWLGDGLVTAPGIKWKHNIKKLSGLFTGGVIDGYQEVFNAQAERLVEKLTNEAGKPAFDLMNYLAFTTLETICQTAFGYTRITNSIVTEEYYRAFNRCLELMMQRAMNLVLHFDWVYQLTRSSKELEKNVAVIHNVSDTVMENRKLCIGSRQLGKDTHGKENTKFKPIIDILLELGELDPLLTEQQIKWEVNTLMVGGQETTATTLLFMLVMLGSMPKIQEQVYQEVRNIYGDSKRPVQKEDLTKVPYCEAVIQETLRMFPAIPGIMRYADNELKLKSCTIPVGTACCINMWGAGRSPRLWGSDAHVFNPDRWLAAGVPAPATFLAFSYGRRACIGKRYAMNIIKTMLIYLVRELQFESDASQLELSIDIALRATAGHLVKISIRE